MVRVFFYSGTAILLCSAALTLLPPCFCLILGGVLALAALILLMVKRSAGLRLGICLLLVAAFCFTGYFNFLKNVRPALQLQTRTATVIGTIVDYPEDHGDIFTYTLKAEQLLLNAAPGQQKITDFPRQLKIQVVDSTKTSLQVFDQIKIPVKFYTLDENKNSLYSNKIYASAWVQGSVNKLGQNRPFYAVFYSFRQTVTKAFCRYFSKEAADFSSALLLGNRQALDARFLACARVTGVSHVLVVSGLHLGIIFQAFDFVFRLLRLSKRHCGLLQLFVVFAFCAVCGFSPSIMRAGLTYAVIALGRVLRLKPEPLNSLGFAAAVCCFLNPYLSFNVAAMLSFFATFGLLFGCPYVMRVFLLPFRGHCKKPVRAVLLAVAQTLTAEYFTFPIAVLVFGYISLIAPITNLLIGYPTTITLCLLLVTVPVLFLPPVFNPLKKLLVFCCEKPIQYITTVIRRLAEPDGIIFDTTLEQLLPYFLVTAAFVCLIVFTHLQRQRLRFLAAALAGIFGLSTALSCGYLIYCRPVLTVQAVKLGYGFSAVITTPGQTVLVGAGDSSQNCNTLQSALLKTGRNSASVLLLPELSRSVAIGTTALVQGNKVSAVLYPKSGALLSEVTELRRQSTAKLVAYNQTAFYEYGTALNAACVASAGAVVNLKSCSVIVLTNPSALYSLTRHATGKHKILVCYAALPPSLNPAEFEKILVSCAAAQKPAIETFARSAGMKNIVYNTNATQTVKWRKHYVE